MRDYNLAEWRTTLVQPGFSITAIARGRLRMDFIEWTARMRTAPDRVAAIRALQGLVTSGVASHFAIETDGSFTIDTVVIEAA